MRPEKQCRLDIDRWRARMRYKLRTHHLVVGERELEDSLNNMPGSMKEGSSKGM